MSTTPDAVYLNEFLAALERTLPGYLVIEASIWVVTLLDVGTELSPEQAAKMFAAEYRLT